MASCGEAELEPLSKKSKQQHTEENNDDENQSVDSRPVCKYGERCFRSSLQHKAEFQHPKLHAPRGHENGHEREERQYDKSLPECPYGLDCEETELIHFAEYEHPLKEVSEKNGSQKEENECEVVDPSEAWSACEAPTQQIMDDDDEDDDDGCDNTDGSFSST